MSSIWNWLKSLFKDDKPTLIEEFNQIVEEEKIEQVKTVVNDQITDSVTVIKPKRKTRKKKSEV